MDLGEALYRFKKASGLSQRDLAELAGVDQATISRAMSGRYGRDGWRAAMTILGLEKVIRTIDGDYLTVEFGDLLEMLSEEMTKDLEATSPDRVAQIGKLQEVITGLQGDAR